MRILYIAPLKDFSGYANAARGYVRALHMAGADLVCRAVRYDRADAGTEYTPTILERELLSKPLENIDIVVQHLTPNEYRPAPGKINIGITAWETDKIPGAWAKQMNRMDAIFTFCQESVDAFKNSGVTVPVYKIPHTFDIKSYDLSNTQPIESPSNVDIFKNKFIFYNISQLSVKKGVDLLLKAYYAQFHGAKDVVLLLKTYIDMASRNNERDRIMQYINSIKQMMRLPLDGYPPVVLITKTLSDEKIKKLHKTGHCYVNSSLAEGWNIPAFEALAYGNKLITTCWGGPQEWAYQDLKLMNCHPKEIELSNVFSVDYNLEPLIGQNHPDPDLYTARELVAQPSIKGLMDAMQRAKDAGLENKPDLNKFDYSIVGNVMLEEIKGIYNYV